MGWGEFAGDSTAMVTLEMINGTRAFYEGAKANASTLNGWTQAPETIIEDNLQCTALLFAAVESARTGQPVDVQEFLARHLNG